MLKDLATAMKKLGLNPTETEIQDLINEVESNGYIYYPEFCRYLKVTLKSTVSCAGCMFYYCY